MKRMNEPLRRQRLLEVVLLFLKLGAFSFGGPAAYIALMEQEAVHKRGWLSREHFLDLLAATNLVPGPNATEMAIHIGFVRAGWPGLVAGGLAFILPAFIICLGIAMAYVRLGTLPEVTWLFYGIKPAVLALILTATYRLGRTALKDWPLLALGMACLVASLLGANEVLLMLVAGLIGVALSFAAHSPGLAAFVMLNSLWQTRHPSLGDVLHSVVLNGVKHLDHLAAAFADQRVLRLGLFFLKVGSLLFGSGMVLFAFIQRDVVTRYGWLTQSQLLDAIAVGQITPGPVLSACTFIGYLVAGTAGAVVSTFGVFFPSFVIVALVGLLIPRLHRSPRAQAFLSGVNAAVVALMLSVSLALFRTAVTDVWTALILAASLIALVRWNVDMLWLVAGGAAIGLLRHVLGQ